MATRPPWLSQVDGTACEVQADTQAHHASFEARRTTHKPQPDPEVWSGCLRGRANGVLSHEGILALQRGEDVKYRDAEHRYGMSVLDIDAFVGRTRALVDATPPTTSRETRAWLVDPFLETLGWDVHDEAHLTDVAVDGTDLEYVLSVDGVPALFVAVEPYDESLENARAVDVLETMAWTGIDRAIYTDGRDYLFLAGTTDADRLVCRLSELPDHEAAIAQFTRQGVGQRLERHTRPFVARQLAIERESLVDVLVDELTDVIGRGDAYRAELESATDRFVDRLVASFADHGGDRPTEAVDTAPDSDVSFEFSDSSNTDAEDDSDRRSEPTDDGHGPRSPGTESTASTGTARAGPTSEDLDSSTTDAAEEDGEYVVRFFNERGSIGAIGHSSSAQALVEAAEYLFERGLSGVSVPWSPDESDDERAVLNATPSHPDGTPMDAPEQLSNGLYLETAGSVDDRAARVEALVDRAGFRAMLSGDWEP